MSTESVLNFIFKHNTMLIEVLFGIVFLGVLYLAVRFFLSKDSGASSSVDLSGIEESLKKIMESSKAGAPAPDSGTNLVGADPVAFEDMKAEIATLKEQIAQKDLELSAKGKESGPALSGDAAKLEEQIRELQGKLDEYAIIEDDIADLSFYKEETVRLQTELDTVKDENAKLKSAAPAPVAVAPVLAEASVSEAGSPQNVPAVSPQDNIDALLQAAQNNEPLLVSNEVARSVSENEPVQSNPLDIVDNDLMAEFQAAVEAQKAATASAAQAKAAAKEEAKSKSAAEAEALVASVQPSPEIVIPEAESVPSVGAIASDETKSEIQEEQSTAVDLPSVDLDKMLNEAIDLKNSEPAEAPNVLDASLDTDKLLSEANLMGSEESDLLADFDKFVKKDDKN